MKQDKCTFFASSSILTSSIPFRPTYSAILPSIHLWPPINECGAVSYGMALQCAETAEVMDTDRVHVASCAECKLVGLSPAGSRPVRDVVRPSLRDARQGRDPVNQLKVCRTSVVIV